jgi:hypothetical protein
MASMSREVDLNKVARQHLEMDGFFTGFALRGTTQVHDDSAPGAANPQSAIRNPQSSVDAAQELAALAAEVSCARPARILAHELRGEGSPARRSFVGRPWG